MSFLSLGTYKVSGLLAEEPHDGHSMNCCADVRECVQHRGLVCCPLFSWWRTLQRGGGVGHPAIKVILQ